jgi:ferredoxin
MIRVNKVSIGPSYHNNVVYHLERRIYMKAHVDQDGCISCGLCIDVCPEVFSYNENDVSHAIEDDIPENCIDRAKEARDGCPVSVIDITE